MDLDIGGNTYSVVNIYAPTQNRPKDQIETLEKLEEFISEMDANNLIIAGDFNCLLKPSLDKNNCTPCQSSSGMVRDRLSLLMEEWALSDVWRIRNPSQGAYTFRRGHYYASRLDFFLTSAHLTDKDTDNKIEHIDHSDHDMVVLSLRPSATNMGPGHWKFDPMLLGNQEFLAD